MQYVEKLILYFTIYSFVGWFCEVIYCSIKLKKIVNRGFLAGPVCPVYGFGALFVIWLLQPVSSSIPVVFLCAIVITSTVEYITGWLLETFFRTRWWDYSNKRFNLEGRVCLENSIYFAILSLLLVNAIHPLTEYLIWCIPELYITIISMTIMLVFVVDSILTLNTLVNLNERLKKLYEFTEELRKNTEIQEWFNEREFLKSFEKLKVLIEEGKSNINQKIEISKDSFNSKFELNHKLREKFEVLTARRGSGQRLIKAFPGMRSKKYNTQLGHLKEALRELKQKVVK